MEGRLHSVLYYYREIPNVDNLNPTWLPITSELDYNSTGNGTIESPGQDLPVPSAANPTIQWVGPNKLWLQSVRAFDYNSFNSNRGIEYAIVLNGAQLVFGAQAGQSNATPWSWVHADDLHYPTCVPWQGLNLVTENAPNVRFKHYRSAESTSRTEPVAGIPTTDEVWSDTPYGEYINEFFTTNVGNVSYVPADTAIPYINFTLDLTNMTNPIPGWTSFSSSAEYALQWVAGFDVTGQKKFVSDTNFVGAIQTTSGIDDTSSEKGTLRVRRIT